MGHSIIEKILARAGERESVRPGDIVEARVDLALANDITAPIAIREFEEAGFEKVFDAGKVALVPDHFTPNKDIKAAQQSKLLREFAVRHHLEKYVEVGRVGIEHVILPEFGWVAPGDVVIGLPSTGLHTNGYSLARKVIFAKAGLRPNDRLPGANRTVADALLAIHRSYLKPVTAVMKSPSGSM